MVYREFELPVAFASIQYHRAPRQGSQPASPPSSPVRQVSYPPVEYKREEPSSEKKGGRKRVVLEKEKESESDSLSELDEEEEEEEVEEEEEGEGDEGSERDETEEDDEDDEGSADEAYTEKGTPMDQGGSRSDCSRSRRELMRRFDSISN